MQLTPSRQQTVEKILRDKNGRLVRATFSVYENAGRVKARLISAVVLKENTTLENKIFSLPGLEKKGSDPIFKYVKIKMGSDPFFSNLLYTSGSKPRAPTL
jgi:hypothetical protein